MVTLPIALQVYSVRQAAQADFVGTLKRIKEMGYEGVEFAGLYGWEPEQVRELCCEIGLIPVSAHVPLVEIKADPEKVFKSYQTIGCRYVAIPYLNDDDRPGTAGFESVIRAAQRFGEIAKQYDITLLYHNHDFEFVKVGEAYGLDKMYETVPADYLQTELDTCWVKVAGEDPAAYIRKYAGRAPVVHLKDFAGTKSDNMYGLIGKAEATPATNEAFGFRPVGSGRQDMPSIIEACMDAGTQWLVVEQDQPVEGQDPMDNAAQSLAYLRSL